MSPNRPLPVTWEDVASMFVNDHAPEFVHWLEENRHRIGSDLVDSMLFEIERELLAWLDSTGRDWE